MFPLYQEPGQVGQGLFPLRQHCNIIEVLESLIQVFILQFNGPFIHFAIPEYPEYLLHFIGGITGD